MKSGKRKSRDQNRIKLSTRDREILHYVATYRMTWFAALHAKFYSDRQPEATKSTLHVLSARAHC